MAKKTDIETKNEEELEERQAGKILFEQGGRQEARQ